MSSDTTKHLGKCRQRKKYRQRKKVTRRRGREVEWRKGRMGGRGEEREYVGIFQNHFCERGEKMEVKKIFFYIYLKKTHR